MWVDHVSPRDSGRNGWRSRSCGWRHRRRGRTAWCINKRYIRIESRIRRRVPFLLLLPADRDQSDTGRIRRIDMLWSRLTQNDLSYLDDRAPGPAAVHQKRRHQPKMTRSSFGSHVVWRSSNYNMKLISMHSDNFIEPPLSEHLSL